MNSCSLVFPEISFPFLAENNDWCSDAKLATGFVRISRVFAKFPLSSNFSVSTTIESLELSTKFVEEVGSTFVRLLVTEELVVEVLELSSTVSLFVHVFSVLIASVKEILEGTFHLLNKKFISILFFDIKM